MQLTGIKDDLVVVSELSGNVLPPGLEIRGGSDDVSVASRLLATYSTECRLAYYLP